MTGGSPEPSQEPSNIAALVGNVSHTRKHYQACRYSELIRRLPCLLGRLDAACSFLDGEDKIRAYALSADAYHVAAGFLLKLATTVWPTWPPIAAWPRRWPARIP
jgi:hypothetical protein